MTTLSELSGEAIRFAQHDPAMALTSLFRPVCRGRRPAGLKVKTEFKGMKLMFTCFEALDVRDQSILLAAVGIAGFENKKIRAGNKSEAGKALWDDLKPESKALSGRAVVAQTSVYKLLEVAGMTDSGDNYKRLTDSLYRLSQVGCRVQGNGYDWAMHLLSYRKLPSGEVAIALNERFAESIAGHYVEVALDERRALKSDPAKVLHAWLCACTRTGSKGLWMGADALVGKVYGPESANASTKRNRRSYIDKAITEIKKIGWDVEVRGTAKKQYRFKRPSIIDQ